MPSTNTTPSPKTKSGISTLTLTREERGHVLTAKVTPGSWTRPHLPFQIIVEIDGKKGGYAAVRDTKLTYSQAFTKDIERLFAQVRLGDCVKCGGITFDPATVNNYKSQCCHACFMAEIRQALTKENELVQKRIERMDKQHKAKGYTHRVTAWVHPENGSDVNIDFWTKKEPTQAEVAQTLKEQGSVVLDDYIIVALT